MTQGAADARSHSSAPSSVGAAAAAGLARARLNLGVLLARGEGVTKDLIEAWALFDLAAAQGLGDATAARNRIETEMSDSDIVKARTLASKTAGQ